MADSISRRRLLKGALGAGASLVGGLVVDDEVASQLVENIDEKLLGDRVASAARRLSEVENAKTGSDWLSPSLRTEVQTRLANSSLADTRNPAYQNPSTLSPAGAERSAIIAAERRLLDGYADEMSVNTGESVHFRISSRMGTYTVSILRLGYYDGAGAREVYRSGQLPGVAYPGTVWSTPGWDANGTVALNWPVALTMPTTGWSSGYYLASLIPDSTGVPDSYIPFVVRDDSSTAPILMQIPFTTYQAYNYWGRKHLYTGDDGVPATIVSFDRPYNDLGGTGHLFMGDLQVLGWLEKNNYPVSYATSVDTHRSPSLMNNRKVFLSVHHDEYWSQAMRNNVVSWVGAGRSLAMLSANNIYWRVRFQANAAGVPDRLMACYKGFNEPSAEKTVLFKDLGQSEVQIEGVEFAGLAFNDSDWVVANANHWIYNGTGLRNGSRISGVIGGEWDKVTSATPPDTTVIATIPKHSDNNGPTVQASVVRDLANGATIFAASTLKYGLFLGGQGSVREDPAIARITTNLLTRIGVTPGDQPPTTIPTPTTSVANRPVAPSASAPTPPTEQRRPASGAAPVEPSPRRAASG